MLRILQLLPQLYCSNTTQILFWVLSRSSNHISIKKSPNIPEGTCSHSMAHITTYLRASKKVAICEVSLYPKYTYGILYTCMYGCRILCMFYMRDMMYHTFVHMYNIIYLRTCGCTVCWRTTLACFSQAHALSHAVLARVDWCAVRFSSMAMLKLSNWSTCYIRSDLGPSGAKYVLLFAKCRYSSCRSTWRMLCGSKWRNVLGKKSTSL